MRRGFTLVELLVVLGIIAMLMALAAGGAMWAVNAARRTAIGIDVQAIGDALEKYKSDKGDYPPHFRDTNALMRHVRTCYPKIAPSEFAAVMSLQLDEGEALMFWLAASGENPTAPTSKFGYGVRNDPMYPFGLTGGYTSSPKQYLQVDSQRMVSPDGDKFPSYRAKYSKDTFLLYCDNRAYPFFGAVTAAGNYVNPPMSAEGDTLRTVRPYLDSGSNTPAFVNPTTFQIICAGQDGEFGDPPSAADLQAFPGKSFPGGQNYAVGDSDNITNFSQGRTLENHLP